MISADRDTVARLGGSPVQRARTSQVLDEAAKLVAEGELRPFVTQTFPLDEAPTALRIVEGGNAHGKIVIEVSR